MSKPASAKKPAPAPKEPLAILEETLAEARKLEAEGPEGAAKALAHLEKAPASIGAMGMLHYAKGALRFRTGDLARAEESLREAVRLDPEVPEFAGNLCAVLIEKARRSGDRATLEEAEALLAQAAARGPKMAMVHANWGLALQMLGRPQEALEVVERALEIEPENLSANLGRASLLVQLGQPEDALAAVDATLKLSPAFPQALDARKRILARLGR